MIRASCNQTIFDTNKNITQYEFKRNGENDNMSFQSFLKNLEEKFEDTNDLYYIFKFNNEIKSILFNNQEWHEKIKNIKLYIDKSISISNKYSHKYSDSLKKDISSKIFNKYIHFFEEKFKENNFLYLFFQLSNIKRNLFAIVKYHEIIKKFNLI